MNPNLQLNCCVHASENSDASNLPRNLLGGSGKLNLLGGDFAKGMPRNWFIVAVAAGKDVVVPTTRPSAINAVGLRATDMPAAAARISTESSIVAGM